MEKLSKHQFTLRRLAWYIAIVGALLGAFASARVGNNAWPMLVAFGIALLLNAAFLVAESVPAVRRWFCLGVAAGIIATAFAWWRRGTSAFVILVVGPKFENDLQAVIQSAPGAFLIAVGLAVICGIALGGLQNLMAGSRVIGVVVIVFLGIWLLLWSIGVAAHDLAGR